MKQKSKSVYLSLLTTATVLIAGLCVYLYSTYNSTYIRVRNWPEKQVLGLTKICYRTADHNCLTGALKRLTELKPNDVVYKSSYAIELTKIGHFDDAIEVFKGVIQTGQISSDVMAFYGRALKSVGRHSEARTWVENALLKEPHNPEAISQLKDLESANNN